MKNKDLETAANALINAQICFNEKTISLLTINPKAEAKERRKYIKKLKKAAALIDKCKVLNQTMEQ